MNTSSSDYYSSDPAFVSFKNMLDSYYQEEIEQLMDMNTPTELYNDFYLEATKVNQAVNIGIYLDDPDTRVLTATTTLQTVGVYKMNAFTIKALKKELNQKGLVLNHRSRLYLEIGESKFLLISRQPQEKLPNHCTIGRYGTVTLKHKDNYSNKKHIPHFIFA